MYLWEFHGINLLVMLPQMQHLKKMGIDTKNEITSHGFRAVARALLHEVFRL